MARSALRALDRLELLGVDSLVFVSEEANFHATGGAKRAYGLDHAAEHAPGDAAGLQIATFAPEETPPEPGLPDAAHFGAGGPELIRQSDITVIDAVFAARGGGGGKPGGGGGGGDPSVLKNYYSGSSAGPLTNPGANDPGFDIWIEFKGSGWTSDFQLAFINAANYFTTVITDDIGGGGLFRGKLIDDLYVSAELKAIDGVGGILGQAGPTAIWTGTDLTAAGQMQFDSADALNYLTQGLWDDIVTHELMHVLGFGTLWNFGSHNLVDGYNYIGASALDAYKAITGDTIATFIPVESDGGSGTAGGHWDEQTLGNELMTGYINNDNYLSAYSVMSLQDLGYAVTYADYQYDGTAQPYTEPATLV